MRNSNKKLSEEEIKEIEDMLKECISREFSEIINKKSDEQDKKSYIKIKDSEDIYIKGNEFSGKRSVVDIESSKDVKFIENIVREIEKEVQTKEGKFKLKEAFQELGIPIIKGMIEVVIGRYLAS